MLNDLPAVSVDRKFAALHALHATNPIWSDGLLHRSISRIDFTYCPENRGYDDLLLAMCSTIVASARRWKKGSSEMPSYDLRVNGSVRRVDASDADKPLLYVLRGLDLTATKFGCGLGQRENLRFR